MGKLRKKRCKSCLSIAMLVPKRIPKDKKAGTPIGPNDMLIAAHALAQGLTLVTDNMNEFARVPGLEVEVRLHPIQLPFHSALSAPWQRTIEIRLPF